MQTPEGAECHHCTCCPVVPDKGQSHVSTINAVAPIQFCLRAEASNKDNPRKNSRKWLAPRIKCQTENKYFTKSLNNSL